jgi:hypothetical protein
MGAVQVMSTILAAAVTIVATVLWTRTVVRTVGCPFCLTMPGDGVTGKPASGQARRRGGRRRGDRPAAGGAAPSTVNAC